MSELLEVLDELTKPSFDHLQQHGDDGEWLRTATVEHPPLLQQLEDAVRASIGSGKSGASSLARERNMLDSDALYHATRIRGLVEDWCRIRDVRVSRDMVVDLRRWYVAHNAQAEPRDEFYTRTMRGWVTIIRGMLDRPDRLEVTTGCPVCGAKEWWDRTGTRYANPIIVEYRKGPEMLQDARALCRACDKVWQGVGQLRDSGIGFEGATESA